MRVRSENEFEVTCSDSESSCAFVLFKVLIRRSRWMESYLARPAAAMMMMMIRTKQQTKDTRNMIFLRALTISLWGAISPPRPGQISNWEHV